MPVNLGTAYAKIIVDSSAAVAGFNRAGTAGASFAKTMAGLGIGAVVAKALVSTVRAASDFNQAMADLNAVTDLTGSQLQQLSNQALKAGAATRFSATEAARGQIELAKAGLSAQQILDGGLDTALALAAAGGLDVAQAASTAANAVQLFGLRGKDLTGVADALAIAANRTTADVSDFSLALQQGGAAAKQVGLPFKDTVTALEALALQGVKGSDAGTSLKAALLSLSAPLGSGQKAIKQYGLEFFKSNGEIKDFTGIAQELQSKLGGLTQKQRTAVLQAIAGRDGFRVLAAAYDLGSSRLSAYRKELDQQGKAAEVAAKRQDSLKGDIEQLSGSIETLQIKAAGAAVPALRSMAQAATAAVNAISSGQGDAGQIFGGIAQAATGLASVLGNVVGVALQAGQAIGSAAAPIVAFTGAVVGSEAGVKILTAAVIGLSAAYLANRAAAVALFAVQKAQAILAAASAFIQLAVSVRTAGQAMVLFQAATMATPIGLFAAGVGAAVGAVALLAGAFRSGPSAAELQAQGLDRVKQAADAAAGGLDRAREAAEKITTSRLQATQAALQVEQAERSYQQAVDSSGKSSLEARTAANQLDLARQQQAQSVRAVSQATKASVGDLSAEIEKKLALRQSNEALITTFESQIGVLRGFSSTSKDAREKVAGLEEKVAKLRASSATTAPAIAAIQKEALAAANTLAGDTSPAVVKIRNDLLAIATAKPEALPGLIAAIKSGTNKGKAAAESGASSVRAALQKVDVAVSLGSFVNSIVAYGGSAVSAALAVAAKVRAALSSANADVRNSPSANDLMRTSLKNMTAITTSGLKETQAAAARGVDSILNERVRLEQRLTALDRAAELRDRKKQGTVKRGKLQDRIAVLDRAGQSFSDLEAGARDIGQAVGDAMDAAFNRVMASAQARFDAQVAAAQAEVDAVDARISQAASVKRQADDDRRLAELQKTFGDAQAKVDRLRGVLARARTDSERQAAETLLSQAASSADVARLDLVAAQQDAALQREREAAQTKFDAARSAAERELAAAQADADRLYNQQKANTQRSINDLVEKLRAGQVTAAQFNKQITGILGDPTVAAALQASGETLGLSFTRGLARTRSAVAAAANSLAKAVADYLKMRSPAKTGPLAFDFRRSGVSIGTDLASGLSSTRRAIQAEANRFAQAAKVTIAPALTPAAAGGGLTQHNTFHVQGVFDARAASRDLAWEARFGPAAAMAGA